MEAGAESGSLQLVSVIGFGGMLQVERALSTLLLSDYKHHALQGASLGGLLLTQTDTM